MHIDYHKEVRHNEQAVKLFPSCIVIIEMTVSRKKFLQQNTDLLVHMVSIEINGSLGAKKVSVFKSYVKQ